MGYRNLRACVHDLERHRRLVRVRVEIDPHLDMAEIQRRVCQAGGPALLFERVKGCDFPMVGNLFGTLDRTRFLFRDALDAVRPLVELKVDPSAFWRNPWRYRDVPRTLWHTLPKRVRSGPILAHQTTVSRLPQLVCWPRDGGAFVTLPQVYTEDVDRPGWRHSNLGMYRVQLSGNQYEPEREVGLHYQIHRGIGVHHAKAIQRGVPFRMNVLVGGPPSLAVAAVMPLPEGLPELAFAGALGGARLPLVMPPGWPLPIPAEADFCICGTVDPARLKPEGPFGDHLGYYSLAHDFPVLKVERVYHRPGAIWPFTVVGRPPQEDTSFGAFIHELTGPIIPTVVPGIHAVHAVDAAGVHPLLLAIGSERYVPYAAERRPQELLTCANAVLGQGQLSLAKYLLIVAQEDVPDLDIHDIPAFFRHLLERVRFLPRSALPDLHDDGHARLLGHRIERRIEAGDRRGGVETAHAADRSAGGTASAGRVRRTARLSAGSAGGGDCEAASGGPILQRSRPDDAINTFPLVVLVDDSAFTARTLNNFLWVTFTRSNPAADVYGVGAFTQQKHWGCTGSLVIDARIKPHHAPPLEEDPAVARRVEALAAPGGPLYRII